LRYRGDSERAEYLALSGDFRGRLRFLIERTPGAAAPPPGVSTGVARRTVEFIERTTKLHFSLYLESLCRSHYLQSFGAKVEQRFFIPAVDAATSIEEDFLCGVSQF
jgi:hypothetical protein